MAEEPATLEPRDERGPWVWVAVGCGALFLVGICFVPPIAWLMLSGEDEAVAEPGPYPPPVVVEPSIPVPPPNIPPPVPNLPPPNVPPPSLPPPPGSSARRVTAVVEDVSGSISGVRAGTSCEASVTREDRPDGTFWCNAQITCGGQLVYGGGAGDTRAGFFDCTLYEQPQRHVIGEDFDTTGTDRDPAMRMDTLGGTLRLRDDSGGTHGAFTLRARVTGVS